MGAQAAGPDGVDKRLDVLATALYGGMTVEDLEQLDLCYAPPFGAARDAVILTGMIAANTQRGISPSVMPSALFREMRSEKLPFLIDVRTRIEYKLEHLRGAVNIPLEQLRERLDETPRDRPVVIQCNVGYRSYVAQQVLRQHGFQDVCNLSGGYELAGQLHDGES